MQQVRSRAPSNSPSSIRCSGSNLGEGSQNLIKQVNYHINLKNILIKNYKIHFQQQYNNEWSDLIVCPFPFHKGGNERTPSFGYNFKRDSFHCFGCGASGAAVEFIAFTSDQDKYEVAAQLAENLDLPEDTENFDNVGDYQEIQRLLFNFSSKLNKLYSIQNPEITEELDKILWWFDLYIFARVSTKKDLNVEELAARIKRAEELLDEL